MAGIDSKNFFKFFEICSDKNFKTIDYFKLYSKYNNLISYNDFIDLYLLSKKRKEYIKNAQTQIYKNNEMYINYREILNKTSWLARELNLKNSLELSTLFTYLLWNGYFSKDMNFAFRPDNRKNIKGMFSLDIMDGKGVCLNFTDMLNDFLNSSGYEAASLINTYNHNIHKDYNPQIHRTVNSSKLSSKMIRNLCIFATPLCKKGNHVFNLIRENNKFYIYDPTNLLLLNPENLHYARVVNGRGKIELNPFYSYSLNCSENSVRLLDSFINSSSFESPYERKDYIMTTEHCVGKFKNNKSKLNNYYMWTKENIDFISQRLELRKNK